MKRLNHIPLLTLLLVAVFMSACNTVRYAATDLESQALTHQEVAVLPVEINYSGPIPKKLSREQLMDIDTRESLLYQNSLYHQLLRKSHKYPTIDLQPIERTNSMLQAQNISPIEAWSMDPQELAQLLGVDAVVRATVDESRYLSDGTALGIDIARTILFEDSWFAGFGDTKTADVRASYAIFDAATGKMLWKMAVIREADWNDRPEEVVNGVNRKIARNFPYQFKFQ